MIRELIAPNVLSWFAQIGLVALASAGLPRLLRLDAPGVRHAYWRAVLALCLVLPWIQPRGVRAPAAGAAVSDTVHSTAVAGGAAVVAAPAPDLFTLLVWIALGGTLVRLAWIAAGYIRLRRYERAGRVATDCSELHELRAVVPVRADIRYVPALRHPVTFGARRPVVLLPESLAGEPADIRRAVLAHELLHVQRRDWAWLLGEEVLRACLWFHPAIWWLVDRVQLSREEVVDELAVAATGRRRAYVEALLAFADCVPLAPATAFARRHHLFRRMVLISKEGSMSSRQIVASCAVMALVVASGAWYAVHAFPLVQGPAAIQLGPGPLESRAHPITAENPIPRRISHLEMDLPAEASSAGAGGTVSLRITLDESGRVAEARPTSMSIRLDDSQPNASVAATRWLNVADALSRLRTAEPRTHQIVEGVALAAVRAVRGWQYEAPFNAPVSFPVAVGFGAPPPPPPPAPAAAVGSSAPGAPAGAVANAPGMPPPPPPAPPAPRTESGLSAAGALRVGGSVKAPTKTRDVRPVYPEEAKAAGIQGIVIIEARIEPDGRVSEARVLRGIPMLDQAATDAVLQWEFTPSLLNGQPVPVIMTCTVNFTLR